MATPDRHERRVTREGPLGPEDPHLMRLVQELRTKQRELELQNEELRRARAETESGLVKYRGLFDFAPVGYFTVGSDEVISEANLAGAAQLGVDRAHLAGRELSSFMSGSTAPAFTAFLREVFSDERTHACQVETAAGPARHLHLEGVSLAELDQGRRCRIAATDVTAKVAAEAQRQVLREQLVQAQRLEAVGRLAGGIAHDFNNMVGVILGTVELALVGLERGQSPRSDLLTIQTAATRSAELTGKLLSLLSLAARQPFAPRVVDLNMLIETEKTMLARVLGEDIELVVHPGPALWPTRIDPTQVNQVLVNLAANSRDAISGGGKVTIETKNVFFNTRSTTGREVLPGAFVALSVTDTGAGMPAETRERAFEPYFTTKPRGKGTGLGLAMVHGILKQNQGFVRVESTPGAGTTFTLYFPHSEKTLADSPLEEPGIAVGGHEHVVLVEDEPTLLTVTTRMLQRLGYQVLAFDTAAEALSALPVAGFDVQLLISDVIMPGLDGRQLSDQLLARMPNLKVLFISGYTSDVLSPHGVLDEGRRLLEKPFSELQLSVAVREALDGSG